MGLAKNRTPVSHKTASSHSATRTIAVIIVAAFITIAVDATSFTMTAIMKVTTTVPGVVAACTHHTTKSRGSRPRYITSPKIPNFMTMSVPG